MSIVRSKTNAFGPATLDIQLEQGANFSVTMTLTKASAPWDVTNVTLDAHMSATWAPGAARVNLTVTKVTPASGVVSIAFPDALSSPFQGLPAPPQKVGVDPRIFHLGGWVLQATEAGLTTRLVDGNVQLDRDPCLT